MRLPSPKPAITRGPEAPRPPRVPRRRSPAPSAPPTRPGWIARWFGRKPRQPTPSRRRRGRNSENAPFSPETHPGFPPEVCALLNTPVEECDPDLLRLILAALAKHIAESLPPELGMTDAQAVFARLWGRLGGVQPESAPDSAAAEQADAASAAPSETLPEAQAATVPGCAAISVIAASQTAPFTTISRTACFQRSRWRRSCHMLLHCGLRHRRHVLPRPRYLSYAVWAGPP